MASPKPPTADLIIRIESPHAESRELARMPMVLDATVTIVDGLVSVTFDQHRFIEQACDALELMVRELRQEAGS